MFAIIQYGTEAIGFYINYLPVVIAAAHAKVETHRSNTRAENASTDECLCRASIAGRV